MDYGDVLAFAKENPVCFIATMDGDQPRVRGFLTVLFEDGRIHFTTGTMKEVYRQLTENPKVELAYCSKDFGTMMRITGEVEVLDDREKKQRLLDERDYLKPIKEGKGVSDPRFVLLRLKHGRARFWTLQQNMRESEAEVIEF